MPVFPRFGIVLLVALCGCARSPATPNFEPYESLPQILLDFAPHRTDDLYRRGYPRDITGASLFRAVLARLENYETLHPGLYRDIMAVTRGQMLERLGDYEGALAAYGNLGPDPSEEMRAVAEQSAARVRELQSVAHRPLDASSLPRYLDGLELKRDDLLDLARRFAGTAYETLARIEAEQADVERVLLLFNSRYILPDGLTRALTEAQALAERHAGSHKALRHHLLLGDFFFTAARDYASVHRPERATFRAEEFTPLITGARQQYFRVSQQDGAPEKPEARGKLMALESLSQQVESMAMIEMGI